MITKDEAMTTTAVHMERPGNRNGCQVWRRNGRTQTWKRDPLRFRLPVKFGLYAYDQITEADCDRSDIHTAENCPHGR